MEESPITVLGCEVTWDCKTFLEKVKIRKFDPDTDSKQLTQIWLKGLSQTVNSKWWFTREWWKECFAQYAAKAMSRTGDMGPEGENLSRNWCGDENNRCMLVAEYASGSRLPVLIGCCGVIRGTDPNATDVDENETTFSIWKMSVDEYYSRSGVGRKLMNMAEIWAKKCGCVKLRMITANPIASIFYQRRGYEWTEWTWLEWLAFKFLGGYLPTGKWHEKELGDDTLIKCVGDNELGDCTLIKCIMGWN